MPYHWHQERAGKTLAASRAPLRGCSAYSVHKCLTKRAYSPSLHTLTTRAGLAALVDIHPDKPCTDAYLVSDLNIDVSAATLNEFKPLKLGSQLSVWPPVMLAPMAGLTNAPLRQLCNEYGAPMCTSEMIIASTLIQRTKEALHLATFSDSEPVRSAQLYGVRPDLVQQAATWLVQQRHVHHIDLNFGCPVRKVTSKGGGSALPLRPKLVANIIAAAVRGAGPDVPVTVKMRIGVSEALKTHLSTARIVQEEGAAAVTLHARTADQLYSPPPDWDAIGELVSVLDIPVIGNGDIFEAADALRMMRSTGCAGVMVGRACLGRPWLFSELREMLEGRYPGAPPALGHVVAAMGQHLQRWADHEGSGKSAVLQMRKLVPCYLMGYQSAGPLRAALLRATSVEQWQQAVAQQELYDPQDACSVEALRRARLKGGGGSQRQRVTLPQGWLDGWDSAEIPAYLDDDACEG